MITPSFSPTATERVLPKLALDFTTASLDPRVTFTRTTGASNPATYTNSSGVITAATNNQPRFDYDPMTLACKGLLIEEQRANLLTYSEQFNDVAWVKAACSITANTIIAPDGTLTGDTLVEDTASSARYIVSSSTAMTTGTTYTGTVYAKTAGRFLQLTFQGATHGATYWASFNLDTGVVAGSNGSNVAATISPVGNGWYRCSISAPAIATASGGLVIVLSNVANPGVRFPGYQGNGTSGIYIWGAQLEAGAFSTSYIPTISAALTRNADVATMTGTNFSDWFNATQGTLACEYQVAQYNAALAQLVLSVGSAAAVETYMSCNTSNVNQFTVQNTTNQANFGSLGSVTLNTPAKICGFYKADYFSAAGNGTTAGGVDTSGTLPTMNKLVFGARNDGARPLNGCVRTFEYWPFTLTTNEILAFSKP